MKQLLIYLTYISLTGITIASLKLTANLQWHFDISTISISLQWPSLFILSLASAGYFYYKFRSQRFVTLSLITWPILPLAGFLLWLSRSEPHPEVGIIIGALFMVAYWIFLGVIVLALHIKQKWHAR